MRNQIVILAAGLGKRMGNPNIPKVLAMLKNKPLILYTLGEVEKINQLVKPIIVVGYMADKVKAVLGDNYIYSIQDKQLGTAHALMAARHKTTGENILVLYGDMPFLKAESLKKLIEVHLKAKAHISLFTATLNSFEGRYKAMEQFGRIVRDANGKLLKVVEYKDANENQKKITEVNTGIYMFNTKWLWENIEKIENKNAQQEFYLTDIVEVAIKNGENVQSLPIDPLQALGINSKEDLAEAEMLV